MKYWMDTEFIERPYTIDLISIGLVAEDGREFLCREQRGRLDEGKPLDPPDRATATRGHRNDARGHRLRHSPVYR